MRQNLTMYAVPTHAAMARFAAGIRQGLALCTLLLAPLLHAQAPLPPAPPLSALPPLLLDSEAGAVRLNASMSFLIDRSGQRTVDDIEKTPDSDFAPVAGLTPHLLETAALWLKFDAVSSSATAHWQLTVPLPGVDDVTLDYRDPAGQWLHQRAGSSQPINSWPQAGRYPVFSLSQQASQKIRYYVRIHHSRVPFSTLPVIVSNAQLINARQAEHMLLGIYFGLTALVVALAVARPAQWS